MVNGQHSATLCARPWPPSACSSLLLALPGKICNVIMLAAPIPDVVVQLVMVLTHTKVRVVCPLHPDVLGIMPDPLVLQVLQRYQDLHWALVWVEPQAERYVLAVQCLIAFGRHRN